MSIARILVLLHGLTLNKVPRDAYWYDDFLATASFRDDYREKYHKEAYVSPAVRYQW
jgi:hypothetical protein